MSIVSSASPTATATGTDRQRVVAFAWSLVAVIAVPSILVPRLSGDDWSWWHGEAVSMLLLALALGVFRRSSALRVLRPFIVVWIAYLATSVALWALLDAVGYIAWTDRTPKYRWVTISVLLIGIPALVMLAAARSLGYTRTELNLTSGDMRARGLVPWGSRDAPWTRLGLSTVAITVAGGSVWIWTTADGSGYGLLLTWLPLGLLFAAVNAAQEELRFRLVPLATLVDSVGDEQAIWLTAMVFGLAHWSGATPAGPLGTIFHGLIGAWLAKSILETRGVAWAWIMHALGNVALFVVLVLTAS